MKETSAEDLDRINTYVNNINNFNIQFKNNFDHYCNMRDFLYDSTINRENRKIMKDKEISILDVNSLESNIINLVNNIVKYPPTLSLNFKDKNLAIKFDNQRKALEDYLRYKISSAFDQNEISSCFENALSGGFSYLKFEFVEESEFSFNEEPIIKCVEDPRLIAFDLMASGRFKENGSYWAEVIPLSKYELFYLFPDQINENNITLFDNDRIPIVFPYKSYVGTEKVYFVCQYYEKDRKDDFLIELADGSITYQSTYDSVNKLIKNSTHEAFISPIIKKKKINRSQLKRTTFLGSQIIEEKLMNISEYPFIFVDGNSKYLLGNEYRRDSYNGDLSPFVTRSYMKNAVGAQGLKNISIQRIANDVLDTRGADLIIDDRSIDPKKESQLEKSSKSKIIRVKSFLKEKDGSIHQLQEPRYLVRPSVSQQLTTGLQTALTSLSDISGSFSSSLKSNVPTDLSGAGDAIRELLLADHATAAPYLNNLLRAIERVGLVLLSYFDSMNSGDVSVSGLDNEGKIVSNRINLDGTIGLRLHPSQLKLTVKSTINSAISKSVQLRKLSMLMKDVPLLAQFFNDKKGSYLIDLMDLDDSVQLKKEFEEWHVQLMNQPPPPNEVLVLEDQKIKGQLALKNKELEIKAFETREKALTDRLEAQIKILQQQNEERAQELHRLRAQVDLAISINREHHKNIKNTD